MNLKFLGAARTVTGSRTLLSHDGVKILVDCGLYQGPKPERLGNWSGFNDASTYDAVLLTHAHIDHSGLIPRLVADGFEGPIYCSHATLELSRLLLLDAAYLQEEDARYANRTGYSHHRPAQPLFTTEDVHRALKQFRPVERDRWVPLARDTSFRFTRSGHILGSCFVEVAGGDGNGGKSVLFSGDLGHARSFLIKPPVTGLECDTLVLESTYGDRIQNKGEIDSGFAEVVRRVMERKGVLVIPAFSVGRTQEVLYLLAKLEREGRIPSVPVFLDSPMATKATQLFLHLTEDHLLDFKKTQSLFPSQYDVTLSTDESKALNTREGPMVVISAAGMLTGGRILHHLKTRLPEANDAVLFVGYQARETKGRLLQEGLRSLRIHHQEYPVRAEIVTLEGLSAHADQAEILEWVAALRRPPRRIFLNHGENGALEALSEKLRERVNAEIVIPSKGEDFTLW